MLQSRLTEHCPRCSRKVEDMTVLSCLHTCCEYCITGKEALTNICETCYKEDCDFTGGDNDKAYG